MLLIFRYAKAALIPMTLFLLHSRSLRLCISSVRFLTQSQSATVYFICMISFFFFLHSCSLRLCISSVRFLLLLSSVNISLTYISDMT